MAMWNNHNLKTPSDMAVVCWSQWNKNIVLCGNSENTRNTLLKTY